MEIYLEEMGIDGETQGLVAILPQKQPICHKILHFLTILGAFI